MGEQAVTPDLDTLERELRALHFRYVNEDELQRGLWAALRNLGYDVKREAIIDGRSRLDFLIGGIAIEVKVAGRTVSVVRQLARYAEHPDVDALILVTTRLRHSDIPSVMSGKPVRVVAITLGGL